MKLSIITVAFNAESSILRTVNSVRRNKNNDIEYIVIDGKSSDSTLQILDDNRDIIDVLISEKDNGIYDALNKGIRNASGDYVMLLAADDELLDGSLIRVFDTLHSDTDVWCGSIIQKNEYGYFLEKSDPDLKTLKLHCSLKNPASLFKRTLFDKFGYYDTRWKCDGDRELFLRYFIKGAKFQVEELPVVLFNEGGISTNNRTKYAIPEGKAISLEYGMNSDEAEKYYGQMTKREKIKLAIGSVFVTKWLFSIMKSDSIYPLFCYILKRPNNKILSRDLESYGVHIK